MSDEFNLTKPQQLLLIRLIEEYQDIFSMDVLDIGHTYIVEHRIDPKDVVPVKLRPRSVPPHLQHFIDETTNCLLGKNLIRE
jgi:hypothetical protein